jgi:hypothetical protein
MVDPPKTQAVSKKKKHLHRAETRQRIPCTNPGALRHDDLPENIVYPCFENLKSDRICPAAQCIPLPKQLPHVDLQAA